MEKRTILFFEDSSKITFGGGQEISFLILKSLRTEFALKVFDFAKDSVFLEKVKTLEIKTCRLSGFGRVVRHQYQSFSVGFLELLSLPFFLIINLWQVLAQFDKQNAIEHRPILFCATKKVLIVAVLVSFLTKCRIVYYAHNINDPNRLICRIFNLFLKRCDIIFAVSRPVCESIPFPTRLLSGAADFNEQVAPSSRILPGKALLTVAVFASLQKWKGIDYFIKSFPLLRNWQKVQYWICGEGPEKNSLQKLVSPDQKIVLKGFVDFAAVAEQIDIMVLPSIQPEAFGMNIIKAMYFGIPIIATDIGAHTELIEDNKNGLKVPTGDALTIAQKIDFLIENPKVYQEISGNGLKTCKQFNSNSFKAALIDALNKLP